ncbi:O-methyltransferase [Ktedonobacter racemifer]|uniref:O-methyltransferase family 3 n=1 Tax=Ktedonobacter racemifer DSM 44963 TaxID=485913 RepID=D6TTW3_KTERA|nr:class I SAM-dependent methyltransferase [Ktedonobacter racemifer]EFH83864.1 O-methyltransferase family 3 [Ktedonobacter racemifer DSM 44963]
MSNIDVRAFLEELYTQGQANDAHTQERGQKMLNLEPETAQFLHILLRSTRRKHILEIGTSNGYSTTWLAWAASEQTGRVVSIDRDPHKHELADANLRQAGLREFVDLKCGNATEIIAGLSGPLDCVFFDADRYSAPAQVSLLLPKLAPDVFLLADNVISHPDEITGYLKALDELPQFEKLVLPIGKGLSVAYRSA